MLCSWGNCRRRVCRNDPWWTGGIDGHGKRAIDVGPACIAWCPVAGSWKTCPVAPIAPEDQGGNQEIAQAIWTSKSNDLEEHSQGWTCSCWVAGSCKIGEMSSMWRHQTKPTRPSCWTENWVWVQCVGIDVAECKDFAGNKYSVMSMVDISAGFHVARVVKEGGTMPTSESCAKALMDILGRLAKNGHNGQRSPQPRQDAEGSGFAWMWSGVRALGDSKCHWQSGEAPRSDEGHAT